jgi:hypothetical protein
VSYWRRSPRASIALIALAVACWPAPPMLGILTYGIAATLYLAYLGIIGGLSGILPLSAVALHTGLSTLLGSAWVESARQDPT